MLLSQRQNLLKKIQKQCLVFDIETSAHYPDGRVINLRTNYDDYVAHARVKWFGAYSYLNNQQYYLHYQHDAKQILQLLNTHKYLVGFNSEEFDYPILKNNGFTNSEIWYTNVDCMQILGNNTKKNRGGFKFKGRGELMKYKFKKSSLAHMAEVMNLDFQKGEIDYAIFEKEDWADAETLEIKKYLSSDVMATKQMFDKLWNYWTPFVELLDKKQIEDLSWIRSSIASLTYKSACYFMGVEPTYGNSTSEKEAMGGRVIEPKYEEKKDVWYIDFASLYPHIMGMFNLFNEKDPKEHDNLWHGNNLFKVKGHYDVSEQHILSKAVQARLKERIDLQQKELDNPMVYTLKIWLNALYGTSRSAIFEQIHTPNIGWDTCWLGQQIHEFTCKKLKEFGFEIIYGDTDSAMLIALKAKFNNKEYVQTCLDKIITEIKSNVPFPFDTFNIKIEHHLDYMMWPFSEQFLVDDETRKQLREKIDGDYVEKEIDGKKVIFNTKDNQIVKEGKSWVKKRKGVKKNYVYIYTNDKGKKDVQLVGLPIMKDNSTKLSIKIYNELLKPLILKQKSAKFEKEFIEEILDGYLKRPKIMKLLAREFKVNPFNTYKLEGQLQAQISQNYFRGGSGVIELIKNNKVGKVGKGNLYCTVEEAIENNLNYKDIDLEKVNNELEPFSQFKESEFWVKNTETGLEYLVNKEAYEASKDTLEIIKPKKTKPIETKEVTTKQGSIGSVKKRGRPKKIPI